MSQKYKTILAAVNAPRLVCSVAMFHLIFINYFPDLFLTVFDSKTLY